MPEPELPRRAIVKLSTKRFAVIERDESERNPFMELEGVPFYLIATNAADFASTIQQFRDLEREAQEEAPE